MLLRKPICSAVARSRWRFYPAQRPPVPSVLAHAPPFHPELSCFRRCDASGSVIIRAGHLCAGWSATISGIKDLLSLELFLDPFLWAQWAPLVGS